jgi:hypothetical protein
MIFLHNPLQIMVKIVLLPDGLALGLCKQDFFNKSSFETISYSSVNRLFKKKKYWGGGLFYTRRAHVFITQFSFKKFNMAAFQYDFFQHLFISLKHDKNQFSQINFNPVRQALLGPVSPPKLYALLRIRSFFAGEQF